MTLALPIRVRVAAAFALTSTAVLLALAAFIHQGLDATLRSQVTESLEAQVDAIAGLDPARRTGAPLGASDTAFGQVFTEDGALLGSSAELSGSLISPVEAVATQADDLLVRRDVTFDGDTEPSQLLAVEEGDQVIVVGASVEDLDEAMAEFRSQLAVGIAAAVVLASAAGYGVAGAALRPMERMRRQAARISGRTSGERLPLPVTHDEVHRLGQTLNTMLDRLDAGLRRERRFVAEASHELRTPLALLRLELDLALSRPRPADELLDALQSTDEEVRRLADLAEELLLLASSSADAEGVRAPVDVGALVHAAADRFRPRAALDGRGIEVHVEGAPTVDGAAASLDRAVSNLLDNALTHGGGDIRLDARAAGGATSISVTDHGAGIDPAFRSRALDRFTRAPEARGRRGHGLGLAIVDAIVTAHGGQVLVGAPETSPGTTVTIVFPHA